ncbi:serine hydrolase domain-containing protein [Hyphococcus sp. DH-69]|uniref:serine hydrolase domain-containing protein n=1 Tax=Hyphococcus formosus TaxID=3143534 RepID=UPI00398B4CE4
MIKKIAVSLCAYVVAFPAYAQENIRGIYSDQIDEIFSQYNETTPGCAVAVDQQGALIHLDGYGMADLEQDVPIRPDTVFYAGSVSKQFVGMTAMLLDHDGRIDLDEPVRTYLPALPDYADRITVRQTLHHTSGLRDFFWLFYLAGKPANYVITEPAIMEILAQQEGLNFEPGTQYAYSNSAYFLISQIVNAVYGDNLDAFAQGRIFEPLDMADSRFQHDHRRLVKRKAHGYAPRSGGDYLLSDSTLDVVGSGGMYSTVVDLIKWDRNFYDNKLGGGASLIDEMQQSAVLNSGEETEYGVALKLTPYRGISRVHHNGSLAGYRSTLQRFPDEKLTIALLCNSSKAKPSAYATAIADIVLAENIGPKDEAASKRDDALAPYALSATEQLSFVGDYYSHEVDNTITIVRDEKELRIRGIIGSDDKLYPVANDHLRHYGRDFDLLFTRNSDGAIESFTVNSARASGIVFEKQP